MSEPALNSPAPGAKVEDQDALVATLAAIIGVLERARVDHLLIGGLAVTIHGRPRHSRDIDFFIRPDEADRALAAAAEAGFDTNPINPHWLYKAFQNGVQVDLIFKAQSGIYLDDEMMRRAVRGNFKGCRVRVVPPEDLLVIKALAFDEETPRHWWDALAILGQGQLDWDYLLRRAVKGPHRVLSLLHYAMSLGLLVPTRALRDLSAMVFATHVER